MKNETTRTKTLSGFSYRAIALVLCFVMLLTAIGSGSVLSAIAADFEGNGASVLLDAAKAGADVNAPALGEAEESSDVLAPEDIDDGFVITKKGDSDIADTGADKDIAGTGYTTVKVSGEWDNWTEHEINGDGFTVSLSANTTYEFVFHADNDWFKDGVTISQSQNDYRFPKSGTTNAKLKTTISGEYIIKLNAAYQDAVGVDFIYPAAETTTSWTAVGAYGDQSDSAAGFFGTAWAPTATANDLTKSGTTWSKTWKNVTLASATTVYYKVAQNHAWDKSYPSDNATKDISAGTYDITVTYNESDNSVDMIYTSVVKSSLTVASDQNAEVSASVNGIDIAEGSSTGNVLAGSKVTVTTSAVVGKKITGVTYTYSSTTKSATKGAGGTYTFDMPSADTTINVTTQDATYVDFYFNNMNTMYSMVFAYAKYAASGDEPLGVYPGKAMTRMSNSNIWTIKLPEDVDVITFVGDNGYNTGELKNTDSDTWDVSIRKTKYTAPLNHNTEPTLANGGTWGSYITRTNEYNVSKGKGMDGSNLFTGVSATLYDYYVDGEVNGKWIEDIGVREYTGNDYDWDPYTNLNAALSDYATAREITYPLYFGNLAVSNNDNLVKNYYHFYKNNNNSSTLNPNTTAVYGLTGNTLANSIIHHYSASDTTNYNGAAMAMFDEDFLSGENSKNKILATILRSPNFPMRKTTEGATTTYPNKVYIKPGDYTASSAKVWAVFFDGSTDKGQTLLTDSLKSGDYYVVSIPNGATGMLIARRNSSTGNTFAWSDVWNQTNDITLPTSNTDSNRAYEFNGWAGEGNKETFNTVSLDSSYGTTTGGHTYYEYSSLGGLDNAFITNINRTDKTADIEYYENAHQATDFKNHHGFFPFNKDDYAKDLGFGMKLEIPFTLGAGGLNAEDNTPQTFKFSGDDDLWVFVDDQLVLDLGGAHAATTGTIDFSTKIATAVSAVEASDSDSAVNGAQREVTFDIDNSAAAVNTVHTMTIYYMERGMGESNLQFGFSFHPIPEQLMVDKKVRTQDVNSGFFTVNSTTDSGHNNDKGKQITKFEYTYQAGANHEPFAITHSGTPTDTDGAVTYTIGSTPYTDSSGSSISYNLFNDQTAYFSGQYQDNTNVTLAETIANNSYYRYEKSFSVVNIADNNAPISFTTSGDNHTFTLPQASATGLSDIRVRARFENIMQVKDLSLTKELTNATDTDTDFTFEIKFKFGSYGYLAYPLYCTVDGASKTLNDDGTISIKAGQILKIRGIPENAGVQIREVVGSGVNDYLYNGFTMQTASGSDFNAFTPISNDNGVTFTMSDDLSATVSNSKPQYEYSITYKYQSYGETPLTNSLYGEQSYTVSGIFTDNEALANLTRSGSTVSFISGKEKNFVISKAPYEDNFMQKLSFANSTLTNNAWSGKKYTCEVTAVKSDDQKVNVKFKLPYYVDANDKSFAPVENSNHQIEKITAVEHDAGDIDVFSSYLVDSKYVKAPLIIYDGSTPYYFQYWKVSKQSSFGMKGDAVYTRCYDYEFILSIFMDCIIEPVYDTTWAQADTTKNPKAPATYKDYGRFDPEVQIDTTAPITIAFLENSRNQYNNGGKGTRTTNNQAMDVIYSDFLLSYNYAFGGYGKLSERDDVKCGLIVEAVDYMTQTGGNFDYTADYSQNNNYSGSVTVEDLKNYIIKGTKPNGCAKAEFDSDMLDNKNSIQYFYSLNNRKLDAKTGNLLNTLQNRYKVFKAYAYAAKFTNGTYSDVQISAPVYFTIYDVGQNGLPDNATNQ